jgi:hypothetical protein
MQLARKLGFVVDDQLTLFTTDTPSPFFRPGPALFVKTEG